MSEEGGRGECGLKSFSSSFIFSRIKNQVGTVDNEHEPRFTRSPDKVSPDCGWEVPEHCLVTRIERSGEGRHASWVTLHVAGLF